MASTRTIGTTGALAVAIAAAIVVPQLAGSDGSRSAGQPAKVPTGDRAGATTAGAGECTRWVAPTGDDRDPGGPNAPWATLEHAVEAVPDRGCTVWFEDGVYRGTSEIERRFSERTVFRAVNDYRAILQSRRMVLDIGDAASLMTFTGFRIRQVAGGSGVAVYVSGDTANQPAPHRITFLNNILHDSFDEDLMKIRSRARAITVRGNVFYNQGANEQHIDVNSVTNVVIERNVFFNAFGASGRKSPGTTKHFIVVKDSNEGDDGLRGSERIAIRRNVFLNWQGGTESFVGIGNDGKPYHEAEHVWIQNNLMIGNSRADVIAPLTVYGARDVTFANNTVIGDLPADAYAFEMDRKGRNPRNQAIRFRNNIWSDPTGTMGSFSDGDRVDTTTLALENNLYWNGGRKIPGGDLVSPLRHDARRVVRDPLLPTDHRSVVVPVWEETSFRSGASSILDEFARLVITYGEIPEESPAVGRALPIPAPPTDILGRPRDGEPDLGAFEVQAA
ncbi:MAG TPA: hypothetical protein VMR89_05920 [Actinomycetota bacterium]|nr:hypothetical protein [Actinomycetota bacterium]